MTVGKEKIMAHERAGNRSKPGVLVAGVGIGIAAALALGAIAYFGASADPNTRASGDTSTPSIKDPTASFPPPSRGEPSTQGLSSDR